MCHAGQVLIDELQMSFKILLGFLRHAGFLTILFNEKGPLMIISQVQDLRTEPVTCFPKRVR